MLVDIIYLCPGLPLNNERPQAKQLALGENKIQVAFQYPTNAIDFGCVLWRALSLGLKISHNMVSKPLIHNSTFSSFMVPRSLCETALKYPELPSCGSTCNKENRYDNMKLRKNKYRIAINKYENETNPSSSQYYQYWLINSTTVHPHLRVQESRPQMQVIVPFSWTWNLSLVLFPRSPWNEAICLPFPNWTNWNIQILPVDIPPLWLFLLHFKCRSSLFNAWRPYGHLDQSWVLSRIHVVPAERLIKGTRVGKRICVALIWQGKRKNTYIYINGRAHHLPVLQYMGTGMVALLIEITYRWQQDQQEQWY